MILESLDVAFIQGFLSLTGNVIAGVLVEWLLICYAFVFVLRPLNVFYNLIIAR